MIELAITTLLLGLVIAAIGACLGGGIRVWDAARAFGTGEADGMLALDTLSRDLRNAFAFKEIGVEGRPESISVPGVWRPSVAVSAQLGAIRYALNGDSLVREITPYPEGALRREALLNHVHQLQFGYHMTAAADAVSTVTSLPQRVRIQLTLAGHAGEPETVLDRMVVIPAGPP